MSSPAEATKTLAEGVELLVQWRRAARRAIKRQRRLQGRLQRELAVAVSASTLRAGGEALKTQLHLIKSGSDRVTVPAPWLATGEVVVELRRDLSPRANLARIFTRARGFEQARADIAERLEVVDKSLVGLRGALERADALVEVNEPVRRDETAELVAELKRHGARLATQATDAAQRAKSTKRKAKGRALPPGVRAFTTSSGAEVVAGRDAVSNDALVTRVARGRDIWFHVRDKTGAHVVLRSRRMDSAPNNSDLLETAALCAHLSGVEKGTWVDVAWTRAKHVRKPKRAAPGLVLISAEKNLRVRVEPAVIDAFYKRRDAARQAQVEARSPPK